MKKKKIASLLDQKVKCIITDRKGTTIKGIQIGDVVFFTDSFLLEEDWDLDDILEYVHDNGYITLSKIDDFLYANLYCKEEDGWVRGKEIAYFKNQ